jgi:D-aminopeptidase
MSAGAENALTDVDGIGVGHVTLLSGDGARCEGVGPVRTGVTVIVPHGGNVFADKVPAAVHVINGFGKAAGISQIDETGVLETPIALTNTFAVGAAWDAIVDHVLGMNPRVGIGSPGINAVVGECNDSLLNDMRGRHVRAAHVSEAIARARPGPVSSGAIGGGTGTVCFDWKGGIGTASRKLPDSYGGFTLGALVLTNLGWAHELTIAGVPIGKSIQPPGSGSPIGGSCVVVAATDAPASPHELKRIARRAQNGLARTGATTSNTSGEYVFMFSTKVEAVGVGDDSLLDMLFRAIAECVEEAVVDSLFTAITTSGADGLTIPALPVDQVMELVLAAGSR